MRNYTTGQVFYARLYSRLVDSGAVTSGLLDTVTGANWQLDRQPRGRQAEDTRLCNLDASRMAVSGGGGKETSLLLSTFLSAVSLFYFNYLISFNFHFYHVYLVSIVIHFSSCCLFTYLFIGLYKVSPLM